MITRGQRLYARAMRKAPTKQEALLWVKLKVKNLDGLKFRRQHPIQINSMHGRNDFFIADFYCPSISLIIELDGGIHESQKEYDTVRDALLKDLGYETLRIPNTMVENDLSGVLALIREYMMKEDQP